METTFLPTNTSKIQLHVEQLLQNTYRMLEEELRLPRRVLVLQPGVRPEPLKLESLVQETGQPGTSRPHVISIGKSSPRDLHLNTNTQLHPMARKL